MFPFVISREFGAFQLHVGMFGVGLRVHGDVLSGRHRHGAGDQAGGPGDQDTAMRPMRGRDAQHKARCGNETIVRAHDRGAQPPDAACTMLLRMPCETEPRSSHATHTIIGLIVLCLVIASSSVGTTRTPNDAKANATDREPTREFETHAAVAGGMRNTNSTAALDDCASAVIG